MKTELMNYYNCLCIHYAKSLWINVRDTGLSQPNVIENNCFSSQKSSICTKIIVKTFSYMLIFYKSKKILICNQNNRQNCFMKNSYLILQLMLLPKLTTFCAFIIK